MEYKDPMFELLGGTEQIVFKMKREDRPDAKPNRFYREFERLRRGTGLKQMNLPEALGVTVAMVRNGNRNAKNPPAGNKCAPDTGKPTQK